jgi:hypothetical protein
MDTLQTGGMQSWDWGTDWQTWACRASHALGLIVVLALLLVLGWAP